MKRLIFSVFFIIVAVGLYAQTPEELFKGEPALTQQDLDIFTANTKAFIDAGKQSNSADTEKVLEAAGLNVQRNLYVWTKVVINFKIYHGNELLGESFTKDEIKAMEQMLPAPLKASTAEKALLNKNKATLKKAYDEIEAGLEGY